MDLHILPVDVADTVGGAPLESEMLAGEVPDYVQTGGDEEREDDDPVVSVLHHLLGALAQRGDGCLVESDVDVVVALGPEPVGLHVEDALVEGHGGSVSAQNDSRFHRNRCNF